jgi:hypothetical protein
MHIWSVCRNLAIIPNKSEELPSKARGFSDESNRSESRENSGSQPQDTAQQFELTFKARQALFASLLAYPSFNLWLVSQIRSPVRCQAHAERFIKD